jgi:tripartite-type tricarboxylate transporter receptor subunit TctC
MHLTRRSVFGLTAGLLAGGATPGAFAQATNWPQRTVKFILPLGPGAGVDIGARLFAERLSTRWGKPVVVENRPGGDGMVAISAVLGANDDHTLLFTPTSSFIAHPYVHEKLPYDPKELIPIARVSNTIVVMAVPGSMNITSLKQLFEQAKSQPGKLNWASTTAGNELVVQGFLKTEGLDMARVPYRDNVQALNDLGEGRIQMYVAALAIVRPQVQSGRVKLLAVTNKERAASDPEVPTIHELKYPGLAFDGLIGLFGTRGVAPDVREKIAADVRTVAADPLIVERLTATGQVMSPGSAAEFAAEMQEQSGRFAEVGKILGIKAAQ